MTELSQTVFVVMIILIVWTALAVCLRIWDRFGTARMPGWDDGFIILSWILSVVLCSTIAASVDYGLGDHHRDVPRPAYIVFLKLQTFTSASYSIGITTAKASFAVLYLRLFPIRSLAILNKAIIVFLLCQGIEESLVVIFKCMPVQKSWAPELQGHCLNLQPLYYSTFVFNFATDVILFIQPVLVTWKLRMPVARRVELVTMLSLGFFVTGIAIIRLKYVIKFGPDDTHQLAEGYLWSAVEVCSLIVCSCIPSLRRAALKLPRFHTPLGLSNEPDLESYLAQQGTPNPLQHTSRKEYNRSTSFGVNDTDLHLSASYATTIKSKSGTTESDDRQDDFPLSRAGPSGTPVAPTEVIHNTRLCEDSVASRARDST